MKAFLYIAVAALICACLFAIFALVQVFFFAPSRVTPVSSGGVASTAIALPPAQLPYAKNLHGIWYWNAAPYYVFDEFGTGTYNGKNLRWWTARDVLFLCLTPEICCDNCVAPAEWFFQFEGNNLTLTHTLHPHELSFTYTRK